MTTEVDRGRKSLRASRPPVVSSGELLGHYQVIEEIGRGGMGTVYRGVDLRLGRQVALKLVAANARSYHARLLREAQALAQLSHPNVVPVYDVGTVHGAVFMAMELVTGQSLRQWLRAARRVVPEILRVFAAAGEGLAAAHAAGLVHRDFKPDNVLVGADGRVRVVDFGLARNAGSFELEPPSESSEPALSTESKDELSGQSGPLLLDSAVTQAGAVIGTPRYMSPEQLRGEPTDSRSDQYSFCVALYEALYETFPVVPDDAPAESASRTVACQYAPTHRVAQVQASAIREASGLVASQQWPGGFSWQSALPSGANFRPGWQLPVALVPLQEVPACAQP